MRDLCHSLMLADTEDQVVDLLTAAGYWSDDQAWRAIDDDESNFSIVGNQQGDPISALVEKVINGVDAMLVGACRRAKIDPESAEAPVTMREAVARFFEHKDPTLAGAGRISGWQDSELTAQARLLTVSATGNKPNEGRGDPSITIADQGEGQTPDLIPDTFMSLQRGNKMKIPFVQGKFNMGGTGALQFCGGNNRLQLIVTRRDPELLPDSATERDSEWGFTVVRREPPQPGSKSSVYRYLAPQGWVLSFAADSFPIFPEADSKQRGAYLRVSAYGSLVKLYEYQLLGSRSNIVQSGNGLLRRLETGLPELALPVRLFEMRDYGGKSGSFATNALGLVLRLDKDKASNLEPEAPLDASVTVAGRAVPLRIYVFKDKEAAREYRVNRQGVIFGINGQAHGSYPVDLFRRKSVGLGYLADSLLVYADCTAIEGQTREDLFMNSRDRLRETKLAVELEDLIQDVLKNNPVLKELNNRRQKQLLQNKLDDDRPLADALKQLIRSNPLLSKLFASGLQLSSPFAPGHLTQGAGKGASAVFHGQRFPTFYRVRGHDKDGAFTRQAQLGRRARIAFETDAENGYFIRPVDPGAEEVVLLANGGVVETPAGSRSGPNNGVSQYTFELPADAQLGEKFRYRVRVTDSSRDDAFENEIELEVVNFDDGGGGPSARRQRGANEGDGSTGGGSGLALPNIVRVRESEWETYGFDDGEDAMRVVAGAEGLPDDYFVNIDNKYLKIAQTSGADPAVLESQFTYALVLLGLAVFQDAERRKVETDVGQEVVKYSRAIAPMIVPMLQAVGELGVVEAP